MFLGIWVNCSARPQFYISFAFIDTSHTKNWPNEVVLNWLSAWTGSSILFHVSLNVLIEKERTAFIGITESVTRINILLVCSCCTVKETIVMKQWNWLWKICTLSAEYFLIDLWFSLDFENFIPRKVLVFSISYNDDWYKRKKNRSQTGFRNFHPWKNRNIGHAWCTSTILTKNILQTVQNQQWVQTWETKQQLTDLRCTNQEERL